MPSVSMRSLQEVVKSQRNIGGERIRVDGDIDGSSFMGRLGVSEEAAY